MGLLSARNRLKSLKQWDGVNVLPVYSFQDQENIAGLPLMGTRMPAAEEDHSHED
jgi:hypothetical protein